MPEFAAVPVIPGPRSGTRNPEAWITKVKCTTGEISLKSNSYMPKSEYNRDLPISGFAGSAARPRNDGKCRDKSSSSPRFSIGERVG
jgi:hypothetical protein